MQGEKRDREEREFVDTPSTPGWLRAWIFGQFPITFEPYDKRDFIPLVQEWEGFGFAHPPHEEAQLWCEKAVTESKKGHHSVLLLPAVFNSIYWRSVIYPNATDIRILACPVKRPGQKKQIVSQMALVLFAGRDPADEGHCAPVFVVEPETWEDNYYKLATNKARFSVKK